MPGRDSRHQPPPLPESSGVPQSRHGLIRKHTLPVAPLLALHLPLLRCLILCRADLPFLPTASLFLHRAQLDIRHSSMIPPYQGWQSYTEIATMQKPIYASLTVSGTKITEPLSDTASSNPSNEVSRKRSHEDGVLEEELHRHPKRVQVEKDASQPKPGMEDPLRMSCGSIIFEAPNFLCTFQRLKI